MTQKCQILFATISEKKVFKIKDKSNSRSLYHINETGILTLQSVDLSKKQVLSLLLSLKMVAKNLLNVESLSR